MAHFMSNSCFHLFICEIKSITYIIVSFINKICERIIFAKVHFFKVERVRMSHCKNMNFF